MSEARVLPPRLFVAAAVASIGGPLALVALYLPGAAGTAITSSGLTGLLAIVVFLAPLAIWLGYSEQIASAGGLTAFVEAAVGRRIAVLQGLVWTVSYFLYLPYTVTYVVYDVLAIVFPGLDPYRAALELVLPVAIVLLVLSPGRAAFVTLAFAAGIQLVLLAVLIALTYRHATVSTSALAPTNATHLGRGVGGVALLLVCASLPLFFASEVGDTRIVRRGLTAAYAIVALFIVAAALPLRSVPHSFLSAALPGVAMAQSYSGRGLAIAIALASAASVTALIVLEYLALGRLIHWLLSTPLASTLGAIAVPFLAADALSLINPDRFYNDLLQPSLIALFLAQLIVVAVYPVYRLRTQRSVSAAAFAISTIAVALFGYGLYTAISAKLGS